MKITPLQRDQVFISYSHKDKNIFDKLQTFLKPLVRDKKISVWNDIQIQPGDKWREEIEQAIASAKVAVLLVSPDFLASDFIAENELPSLLMASATRGLKIIWVAVSHSIYKETAIAQFQAANDPARPLDTLPLAKRNKVFVNICERVAALTSAPPTSDSEDLFAGLDTLKSRRNIEQAIREMIAHNEQVGTPTSVIFLDIDGMTGINKRFGLQVGDEIIEIVENIFSNIHDLSLLVHQRARWGRDEFVSWLPIGEAEAFQLAESVRAAIAGYYWTEVAADLYVTASLGVAQFPSLKAKYAWQLKYIEKHILSECLIRAIYGTKLAKKEGGSKVMKGPPILHRSASRNLADYGS